MRLNRDQQPWYSEDRGNRGVYLDARRIEAIAANRRFIARRLDREVVHVMIPIGPSRHPNYRMMIWRSLGKRSTP